MGRFKKLRGAKTWPCLCEALSRITMGVAGEDLLGLHGKRVIIVSDYRRMRVIRL